MPRGFTFFRTEKRAGRWGWTALLLLTLICQTLLAACGDNTDTTASASNGNAYE